MLAFDRGATYRGGVSIVRAFALVCFCLGLFVQSAAQASASPSIDSVAAGPYAEMGDGMADMAADQSSDEKPCKRMTLNCLIVMGCLAPLVIPDADIAQRTVLPAPRGAYLAGDLAGLRGKLLAPESPPPQAILDI